MKPAALLFGGWEQVIGVPDHNRGTRPCLTGPLASREVPDLSGSSSPCNAMFSSKGEITCGVSSSVAAKPLPGSNTPAFNH